jgi:hypothetical protein
MCRETEEDHTATPPNWERAPGKEMRPGRTGSTRFCGDRTKAKDACNDGDGSSGTREKMQRRSGRRR